MGRWERLGTETQECHRRARVRSAMHLDLHTDVRNVSGFMSDPETMAVRIAQDHSPGPDPTQNFEVLGLQVSGQAAALLSLRPTGTDCAPVDTDAEVWSASDDGSDHDTKSYYRSFRWAQKRLKSPQEVQPRRRSRVVNMCSISTESDVDVQAWSVHDPTCIASPKSVTEAETPSDDIVQVSAIVSEFYGLRDSSSLVFRNNLVTVEENAWNQRTKWPLSIFQQPPIFWVRGQRVYDCKNDRGTLNEFESDFLIRQVEDDGICRSRRHEQGLQPFPFLPLPLKKHEAPTNQCDELSDQVQMVAVRY